MDKQKQETKSCDSHPLSTGAGETSKISRFLPNWTLKQATSHNLKEDALDVCFLSGYIGTRPYNNQLFVPIILNIRIYFQA